MQKPISSKAHGILDYTTSSAVMMAPKALNLPKRAAAVCYGLAAGMTGLSLLTNYPAGAKKAIPFKGHGAADVVIGAALPFVPHMLGLTKNKKAHKKARYLFWGLAGMTATIAAMTDWNSGRAASA